MWMGGGQKVRYVPRNQGNQTFWAGYPEGFCRELPGAPEKFEKKKFGFKFRSLNLHFSYIILGGITSRNYITRNRLWFSELHGQIVWELFSWEISFQHKPSAHENQKANNMTMSKDKQPIWHMDPISRAYGVEVGVWTSWLARVVNVLPSQTAPNPQELNLTQKKPRRKVVGIPGK